MSTSARNNPGLVLIRKLGWGVFAVLPFLGALLLAWHTCAAMNFLYPVWYDALNIDKTIEVYAPQNHYKAGFEHTDRQERDRLFAGIVRGVDSGGKGLSQLTYHNARGQPIDTLLRTPEIEHLRDVAVLITWLSIAALAALGLWVFMVVWVLVRRHLMPSVASLALRALVVLGVGTGLIFLIGPERVFYHLHEWVFPAGDTWFFYYRDSLMTTIMKAPDLFGPITIMLAVVAMIYWLLMLGTVRIMQHLLRLEVQE